MSSTASTIQSTAPLLVLPIELMQYMTRFLEPAAAAAFSLSCSGIYHAVGKGHLEDYLSVHTDVERELRADRRLKLEVLERAFPSHWYCAWCEKFHAHDIGGGPSTFDRETKRDCQEHNSSLHDEKDYVLCYHHVRLAMNRHLWGSDYGLPLSAFSHSAHNKRTIASGLYKGLATTHLRCEARIIDGHFILHAAYTLTHSPSSASSKGLNLWSWLRADTELNAPDLPQIVCGHRDLTGLHTDMSRMFTERLESTSHENPVHGCKSCATDFTILSSVEKGKRSGTKRTVWIEVWRNLGTGRSPFDSIWRGHGESGEATKEFIGRFYDCVPGSIKKAFEGGNAHGEISRAYVLLPEEQEPYERWLEWR